MNGVVSIERNPLTKRVQFIMKADLETEGQLGQETKRLKLN